MKRYVQLTDSEGERLPGTDGLLICDGRWKLETIRREAWAKRETYKKHFPNKYNYFTHFGVTVGLRHKPKVVFPI